MSDLVTTDLEVAVSKISQGYLCAIPTETVYGLAASATNPTAIARVFEAKGRPTDHPLIVHVAEVQTANLWIKDLPKWTEQLVNEYWPGPLTIVGSRTELASNQITAAQETVAVRVPDHPVALKLLAMLRDQGIPGIVAPSANKFGQVSPTTAKHVINDLGHYLEAHNDIVLDGGACIVGIESTIVLVTKDTPVILRPGIITAEDIERVTGIKPTSNTESNIKVSGNLAAHYSPKATVEVINDVQNVEFKSPAGFIALSNISTPANLIRLATPTTTNEFASSLYSAMRLADEQKLGRIYVVVPDANGIGSALIDRISRAAHSKKHEI